MGATECSIPIVTTVNELAALSLLSEHFSTGPLSTTVLSDAEVSFSARPHELFPASDVFFANSTSPTFLVTLSVVKRDKG